MNPLTQLLEAAFFAAAHPLSIAELARLQPDASHEELVSALTELGQHYTDQGHAVELVEVADGYQVVTRSVFADAVAEAQLVRLPRKLSRAALETLAVIAYRQPVSRAEIEEIRGVSVEGVLRSLQERGLVAVTSRGEGLGRPLLYGTTDLFLEHLGLKSQDDLPRLDELSIALRPMGEMRGMSEM